MRLKLALGLMTLVAAIAVSGAAAADFEGDAGSGADCTEPPGGSQLLRCPTAHVGEEYEVEMESEEGSGCTSPGNPYVWYEIVNSSLPPGLTMTRTGVISGIPTSTGFYRFWVWNHDLTAAQGGPSWCEREDRSEVEFSIYVDPGLEIANESLKAPTLGQAYSDTLTAQQITSLNPPTGSDIQATWSVESGALPPGLALSAEGTLTGTPTAEGSWGFVIRASNGGRLDSKEFGLAVRQPVTVKSPLPAVAEVGVRFAKTVTATGGSGAYRWSVSSGALPGGLVLDPAKGTIAGTPTSAGNAVVGLTATDSEGRTTSVNGAFRVAAKLAVTTSQLKSATVGSAYRAALRTTGGIRPVKWKVVGGKLPSGVKLSPMFGTLTGTPKQAGTYRVTVEARDALGAKSKRALVLTVQN
jgi:large repetitive protein